MGEPPDDGEPDTRRFVPVYVSRRTDWGWRLFGGGVDLVSLDTSPGGRADIARRPGTKPHRGGDPLEGGDRLLPRRTGEDVPLSLNRRGVRHRRRNAPSASARGPATSPVPCAVVWRLAIRSPEVATHPDVGHGDGWFLRVAAHARARAGCQCSSSSSSGSAPLTPFIGLPARRAAQLRRRAAPLPQPPVDAAYRRLAADDDASEGPPEAAAAAPRRRCCRSTTNARCGADRRRQRLRRRALPRRRPGLRDAVVDTTSLLIFFTVFGLGASTRGVLGALGIKTGVAEDTHVSCVARFSTPSSRRSSAGSTRRTADRRTS